MPELLTILLTTIAPIILIASLGALLDRTMTIEAQSLSRVVIYMTSPCLAFYSIANSSIQAAEFGRLALFAFAALGSITLVAWLISLGLKMDRLTASGFVLSVALINGVNYGLPLNEFAFGQAGMERAIIVGIAAALYAYTMGVFLASWGRASPLQAFTNVLKVPMPYAAFLGLAVNLWQLPVPEIMMKVTRIVSGAAVPLMLIMLGIQIGRSSLQGQWRIILGASSLRLVGGAGIGLLLAPLFGMQGVTAQVAIAQSATPTAVISAILATEFNSDAQLVSSVIVLSTLLSTVTITLLLAFLM